MPFKDPVKKKYNSYQYTAQGRHEWSLTFEEFHDLITKPCKYCGEQTMAEHGIDRVNNSLGYNVQNCVPCCKICNLMKYTYTAEQFLRHCNSITNQSLSNAPSVKLQI